MMRRTLLFTLALSLSWLIGQGNDSRLQALLEAGQQHLREQRFHQAENYFLKALELDDQNVEAHYYLADCKRHRFRYDEALTLYQTAQNLDSGAFPLATYYVALMQKQTGAYRTAHQTFEEFITRNESVMSSPVPSFVAQAKKEIEGIKFVYELALQSPLPFSLQHLPAPINSPAHDYAAQILPHDSSVLISSTRPTSSGNQYDERYGEQLSDFFVFKNEPTGWVQQISASDQLNAFNSNLNEGSGVSNPARDQFYFTGCYQDSTCRIFTSQLTDGDWSSPLPLGDQINYAGYNTKHPAFSAGGDTLYFTSDRPGGFGQFDLWMSVRINNVWQAPANLGAAINTSWNEVSPAYYPEEQALLFASDGQVGLGGYDLFVAYHIQDSLAATVDNLGTPLNSAQDDLYMSVSGQQAFLTSNRNSEDGNFDLYSFRMRPEDLNAIARRPDPSINWYELQLSATELFAPEDRKFYEQLPLADKVRATHYIERQSFREALSQQMELIDTTEYRYEELSGKDQALVSRLARAKKQFVQKEFSEEISPEDRRYYESLSLAEKGEIDQLVDQQWFKQLLLESATPEAETVYFYEKLPAEEQEKIKRAIQAQQVLHQRAFTEQPTLEDIFFYQSLPLTEKEEIEQMIAAQQFMERVWEEEPNTEMDYVYEQLTPDEQQQIKRYVSRQSFQLAMAESAVLSEEVAQHYEALSPREKESVSRLAQVKKQFLMKESIDETSLEDQRFYESLPPQEKEIITRVIDAQVFDLLVRDEALEENEAELTLKQLPTQDQQQVTQAITRRKEFHQRSFSQLPTVDDVFAYQALSDEEKNSIQRLSGTQQFAIRQPTATALDQETKIFYEKLPHADQESVGRLVENRKKFLLKGEQTSLPLEDQYFLETLSTKEKQQVKLLVEARVFDELMNEEMQTTQLSFRYQNLHGQEKQRIDRLARTRHFFSRVVEEDASTPPEYFSFDKIEERPSEQVIIDGRLSSRRSGAFPERVFLVNDQSDTLATAPVRADGTFTFAKVAYQENYRVEFKPSARTFTQQPEYKLEELSVVSLEENIEVEKPTQFSNIYFATNQFALPASAPGALDSVVRFHLQHPDVNIEVRSFADSTGTQAYNLRLTQRRSRSVQQYLTKHGVDPNRLSELAMGAIKGDDLAVCRRVELVIGNPSDLPSSAQTIYIIQAQPNLQQIADRYQISLEKLKKWNQGKEQVPPYTPVRVVIEAGR